MIRYRIMTAILAAMIVLPAAAQAELRGAWVTAWAPGFFTQEQCDATIAAARQAGLNALFIQVRKNADSYYTPGLEPRAAEIAPDFDPLAYIIKKARPLGIQVYAWVNVYRVWTSKVMPTDPDHVVSRHPEWLTRSFDGEERSSEGLYLDPGIPEAREHVAAVVADIASRYEVDGIQLDYIRYPGKDWGYSDRALARYYAQTGASAKPSASDPRWLDWRRKQVTEMVRLIKQRIARARPGLKLSASTIAWGGCPDSFSASSPYASVCQDWRAWLAEGVLDINIPMNYKSEKSAKSAQQFRDWLAGFRKWGSGGPVYVGIEVGGDPAGAVQQIAAVREYGLDGFVLFAFNQTARRDSLVKALSASPGAASTSSPTRPTRG